ncbi:VWA domain-containing protein [Ruegeria sp.]|uniref:VWA domain-containing protein n=1 Tax=Ruegeria sp. TaxID=1879320 RepID=UPI003B5C548D
MGGKNDDQVIGHKHFRGFHFIGPTDADALLAIRMDDKIVWEGYQGQGRLRIRKPNIFGGDEKEGGVSGYVDVLLGGNTQGANDYLQKVWNTTAIPAFRGAVTYVWRRVYIGNRPILKPLRHKSVAINSKYDNWYPEKARVNAEGRISNAALYIAMDTSDSMAIGSRLATQRDAIKTFIDSLKGFRNDVRIVSYAATERAAIERLNCTDSDYDDIKDWLDTQTTTAFGTDYDAAVSSAPGFFSRAEGVDSYTDTSFSGLISEAVGGLFDNGQTEKQRVVVFVTDGEPVPTSSATDAVATLATIADVRVHCFNIELTDTTYTDMLDNTPGDGVPVVSGADPDDLSVALANAFSYWSDINPAHAFRALVVDPVIGGNDDPASIGDSFTTSADLYFNEGMGVNFFWKGGTRAEYRRQLEEHTNSRLYRSRQTGKWELYPIRKNYVKANLPVFDKTIIKKGDWAEGPVKPWQRDLPNQVTLQYTRRDNGEKASVTSFNIVGIQLAGKINPVTIERPGFSYEPLATQVCEREKISRTVPGIRGAFYVAYLEPQYHVGSPIRINQPELGINDVVFRIKEIGGEGMENYETLLTVEQERFDQRTDIPVAGVSDNVIPDYAQASTIRLVEEAPYYELVQRLGQSSIDDTLSGEPDGGLFHATGNRPTDTHLDMGLAVDSGSGWGRSGVARYSPASTTLTALTRAADDTSVDIAWMDGLETVQAGSLAYIGGEYVRIDNMTRVGDVVTVTLGRACLDTAPVKHGVGTDIIFWQGNAESDQVTYLVSEQVDIRLLGQTFDETLNLSEAPNDQITFNSRAVRPYPPGAFTADGEYTDDRLFDGSVDLAWTHSDRTQQTTGSIEDHTHGNIGPEAGTTYQVRVKEYDSGDTLISTLIDTNVGTATSYTAAPTPSATAAYLTFEVASLRDGYECWQVPTIKMITTIRTTEAGVDRTTEDGTTRTLE